MLNAKQQQDLGQKISGRAEMLLVSSAPDIRYLSGFTGEGWLLYLPYQQPVLLTESRFTIQAVEESPSSHVIVLRPNESMVSLFRELCRQREVKQLGIQKEHLSVKHYEQICNALPEIQMIEADHWLQQSRESKNDQEIALIRRAGAVADEAFAEFIAQPVAGLTERALKLRLETLLYQAGAEAMAFDTIVAAGENAAKPHAVPSPRVVQQGEVLLLDFGAVVSGYHSDVSRTLFVGQVPDKIKHAFEVVQKAKNLAASTIKAGVSCREADEVARTVLREGKLEEYFTHGLGHGVGLEIHEAPRVSAGAGDDTIKEGAVITIEPGVYFEGEFGIRLEDTYVVEKTKCRPLTLSQSGPFVVK